MVRISSISRGKSVPWRLLSFYIQKEGEVFPYPILALVKKNYIKICRGVFAKITGPYLLMAEFCYNLCQIEKKIGAFLVQFGAKTFIM